LPAVVVIAGLTRNLHARLQSLCHAIIATDAESVLMALAGQARNDGERVVFEGEREAEGGVSSPQ
jgi:hypothetical protein